MTISSLFLILSGIFNALLALAVLRKGENPRVKKFYGILAVNVMLWCLSIFLFRTLETPFFVMAWGRLAHIAAVGIAFSLFFFSIHFPYTRIKKTKILSLLLLLLSLLLIYLLIFSNLIIDGFKQTDGDNYYQIGYLYLSYSLFIAVFFFISFIELFIKFLKSKGIEKLQIEFIFLGLVITGVVGVTANLILPGIGIIKYNWLGPIGTFIMLSFFAYAILKHHLLNIKVIATEIFSILMAVILLIDAILTENATSFILKFSLFIAVVISGLLLIRSVTAEIRARQKIQELAENLEAANEKLKQLDQEKSDFLSIASHQLRTPMTVIKGYVSMIKEGTFGKLTPNAEEAISKVYISNQRLIKLIGDLLDISRIERGKMKYEFSKQNIQKIVEESVGELKSIAESKGLKMNYKKPKEKIPEITMDGDYIKQVVMNLLDNAIKYTIDGGISIELSAAPEKVILKIKDTGEGISNEGMKKLFQKYERGLKEGSQGLGMGLFVAKKIMDDHKGKIWAESGGEGKGSTFIVELPIS
ncbi:MAG: ATP-binding protein [Candidatus Pacebacteria bacterium]|nr:ATP-binding protein [Candidatus Paceibacterota bacterium]